MFKLLGKVINKFKYVIALLIFAVVMIFVGDHCWLKRLERKKEISELKEKIEKEDAKFLEDSLELIALDNDIDAVRKIARERYYMKNSGEDVFLIQDTEDDEEAEEEEEEEE